MNKMKIAEMTVLSNISDDNLMIIEDFEDTKQSTIMDLKRAFCGDSKDPSSSKFYSSLMVSDLFNTLNIRLSTLPSSEQLDNIKTIVNNLQAESGITTGEKDAEIVAARGTYPTLSDRLIGDRNKFKEEYIQFPVIDKTSMVVNLSDIDKVRATISCPAQSNESTLTISGKNKYKLAQVPYDNVTVIESKNGLRITYTPAQNTFTIPIGSTLPAGTYAIYSRVITSDNFIKPGAVLKLIHSDNSTTVMNYDINICFSMVMVASVKGSFDPLFPSRGSDP